MFYSCFLLTLMQLSKRTFAMEYIEDHGCCISSLIVLWLTFIQTTTAAGAFNLGSLMGRYHCISTMVGTSNLYCFVNGPQSLLHDQSSLHQPEVKLLQTCNSVYWDELMDSSDATTNNTSLCIVANSPWNNWDFTLQSTHILFYSMFCYQYQSVERNILRQKGSFLFMGYLSQL